ncbi:MAG: ATP-binding protein, partial [Candidatus Binatia bacterium]
MDYTAQGETVNLAARLQQAAAPGGVLLSEATHRLVRAWFVTSAEGPLSLKGIPGAVTAFAVTAQKRRRARFAAALERGLAPHVGRRRELDFLRDGIARLRSGRGQSLSIAGEAGIGKSRLLHELRRELGEEEVTWSEAQCLPHGESHPFHLILPIVQSAFRIEEGDAEAEQVGKIEAGVRALDPALEWVIPHVKHLLALSADEAAIGGLDPAQRKRRLIEAVRALALRSARNRPLVIVAEDLQWIDPNSQDFLSSLADVVGEHPVLLLCSHRAGYTPPWHDRSTHQRLALEPLPPEETLALAQALLGPEVRESTKELVVRRAEGNPLYVEELAGFFHERLAPSGGASAEAAEAEVPETIRDLLAARIDRLPDPVKETLQIASVLGRDFPLPLLEALAPSGRDLRSDLSELVRLELLRETEFFPEARYRFAHVLTREVAYQGLLHRSRAELHARAGEALEKLYGERIEELLPELARHYGRSGEREKAVRFLVAAGDRSARLFAFGEARSYYRQALEKLGSGPASRRAEVRERRGDAAFAEGILVEALRAWGE